MERNEGKFVIELLSDYKRSARRWFILSILLLITLFSTIALYEFKEASYDYITITQDGDLNNVNSGSGSQGNITNGDLSDYEDYEYDSGLGEESGGVLNGVSGS